MSGKRDEVGFTLIELLVVIAIIGVLASTVLASLNSARAKARDARKQADFRAISLALQLFFDSTGRMPANNWSCSGVLAPGAGSCGAGSPGSSEPAYDMTMQELINAGFLTTIPRSPGVGGYGWYNYGGGNGVGGLMQTTLETIPLTTTGIPPSCRPFSPPGANWCTQVSDNEYCICNIY